MTTIQKRKLVRWIAGTAFFIYLGIVITIVVLVMRFLAYRYDTEKQAYLEAKEHVLLVKLLVSMLITTITNIIFTMTYIIQLLIKVVKLKIVLKK